MIQRAPDVDETVVSSFKLRRPVCAHQIDQPLLGTCLTEIVVDVSRRPACRVRIVDTHGVIEDEHFDRPDLTQEQFDALPIPIARGR